MAFKPGTSGNAKGRPTKIATAQQLRDAIAKDIPQVLKVITDSALAGDMAACKLLLDKSFPAIKAQSLPVTVPVGDDMVSSGNNVIIETFGGQLSPDVGAMLLTALANQAKVEEVHLLQKRIEELEKLYGDSSKNR